MTKIAITGVTGNFGRIVIEDLLTRVSPGDLVAVVRTSGKAADLTGRGVEVRHGDYDDPASLDTAFGGVDLLLLVSGSDLTPGVRVVQHRTVVERAAKAGVRRIVYTSAIGAESGQGSSADHAATEKMIGESGLTYTVLRNTLYSEAFVGTALAQANETGEVVSSIASRPLNTARLRDLALAAGAVLSGSGHDNATYELRGPLWTYPELAEALAKVLRRPVAYREVTDAEAGWLGSLFPMVRAGAFARTTPDLSRLLGRPATGLEDTIAAFIERVGA
ncbi:NAD(P)H-binding protein [Streptosporangium subroseum]|uniref:NAD(P)H-binding protein n=1 Tax=Streptosporangium subroseum TaxID=106412 RepID=UPI00309223EA|nr:NAD(P)H-binding protein [Streptosporangium subroseum]